MQAELKGQRMWPWEEPVEKVLGSGNEVQRVDVKSLWETQECCVARWARRRQDPREPLLRLVLTALEVHLGWGGGGSSRGRASGEDTRSVHRMEPKEGSGYKSPAAVDMGAGSQAESTLPRSREQEGGREKAEWDGPAKDA